MELVAYETLTHLNVAKMASEICNALKNIDNIHVLKGYTSLP